MKIDVLDKGFVECLDVMGSDMTTVNTARVSFNQESSEFTERDGKLVRYLADHQHTSPFRHAHLMLRFKAPLFVARQLWKHVVGISVDFDDEMNLITMHNGIKDMGWNEQSGRYVELQEEFYVPEIWRKQSANNKQGSDGTFDDNDNSYLTELYTAKMEDIYYLYNEFVQSAGVAKEQARIMLPVSIYTQWIWTGSLQAFLHVVHLRYKEDAQYETRCYGRAVRDIIAEHFPVCLDAWENKRK